MRKELQLRARLIIFVIGFITMGAFYFISQLSFSYDFESFFPKGNEETEFYKQYREIFGTDNDFIIIGLENEKGIFEELFLREVDGLTKELKNLPYVSQVVSLTNSKEFVREPLIGQLFEKPILHFEEPERYEQDSIMLYSSSDYVGSLISKDAKSTILWIKHDDYLSKLKSDTIALALEDMMSKYSFDKSFLMGRTTGQKIYVNMMQDEMVIFMSLSFLLILVFLFIAFRSFWGVWIPVVVVTLAIVWNLAVIKLLGHQIELLLTILPTIIFVVGMSDVIHIVSRYLDELRLGTPKNEAILSSMKEVGLATFLTSITTAIGFLSLLTSSVMPISRFGTYIAIGVILAFVLAFSLLPAIFYLRKKTINADRLTTRINWTKNLHRVFLWLLKSKTIVISGFVFFVLIGVFGASKIVSNNFLLEDIGPDHPLRQEMNFFDQNFSGARPVEIALILDSSITELTPEVLNQIDLLDGFLEKEYGVGTLISPAKIIKKVNKSYHGGKEKYNRIPEKKRKLKKLSKVLAKSDVMPMYWSPENNLARIYGQTQDLGRIHFNEKNEALVLFLENELPDAFFEIKVTGTARLMDLNNEQLSITMIYGLLLAFALIALIIGLLYKSISMVVLSLIPNVMPLILIAGFMGFTGIPLKVTTSIIFTIAFGIAVDDTIHFLSKFRLELAKGKSKMYALKRTYISTGKAIVITSLILCGGFLTLIFSDFLGTYYVGLLISLTLIFAVLSDLLLLPVLIMLFYKSKRTKNR